MSSEIEANVTPVPNGPYVVKNLKNLNNIKGAIEVGQTVALCRCGGSNNKPFCDGTHVKNGFTDKKLTDGKLNKRNNYVGKQITVHDNRGICAHAGYCTDNLSSVFKLSEEPWIDPDGATAEDIITTIKKCPSGALSHSVNDANDSTESYKPAIMVAPNGPYVVSGRIELTDTTWGVVHRKNGSLCVDAVPQKINLFAMAVIGLLNSLMTRISAHYTVNYRV